MHWYGNPNRYSTFPGVSPNKSGNTGHRGSSWPATRYSASGNRHRFSGTAPKHDSGFWSGCNRRYGSRHRYSGLLHNSLYGNRRMFSKYGLLPARNMNYDWGIARAPNPGWWCGRLRIQSKYHWPCGWGLQTGYSCSGDSRHRYLGCWYIHLHDTANRIQWYVPR